MSVRKYIFIPMIVMIVLCTVISTALAMRYFLSGLHDTAQNKVEIAATSVYRNIESLKQPARLASAITADDFGLENAVLTDDHGTVLATAYNVMALAQTDFCTILDNEGIVIARTHDPDRFGDSLAYQHSVTHALQGDPEITIEPGTVIRLSVRSAAPIFDDNGDVVGVVSLGYRLDTPEFTKALKEETGCEVVIYRGTECVSSTLMDETGCCLICESDEAVSIVNSVLAGGSFFGDIDLDGRSMLATFMPIDGPDGEIVGVIAVGDFWREDNEQIRAFQITGAVIGIIFLILVAIASILVTLYIDRRLSSLVNVVNETSKNRDAVMEALDTMIVITTMDTDEILYMNNVMKETLGLGDSIIGEKCWKHFNIGVDGRCAHCPKNQPALFEGESYVWEFHNPHVNRDHRITSRLLDWPDGTKVLIEQVDDITDMKERRELEHQNLRLNLLINGMKLGLWDNFLDYTKEEGGSKITWSDEFRRLFGFDDEDDFPNDVNTWYKLLHPEDYKAVRDAITAFFADKTGNTPYNVEYRARTKTGAYRWFRSFAINLREEDGNIVRTVGATEDITDRKEAEIEIMEKNEQLEYALHSAENANRVKSAFLANISHEIRTPMNAILGITEIQLRDENLSKDIQESLEMVYESGNLLLNIINDILDLSKIESGKLELIPVKYDMPSLINDTAALNRMRYENKPISFKLDVSPSTPINMYGDELRIKQILNNILSNAFKYTDRGEIIMSVSAASDTYPDAAPNDMIVTFRVSDTGQGMTEEQLDMLFDEYKRFNMDANRTTIGTGLGMSITRHLVDLMNGEILVESEVNTGSVFTVNIPQKKVDNLVFGNELAEKLRTFKFSGTAMTQKSHMIREYMPYGSVLIVDDVESNIYVTKGLLLPYGLKIDAVTSGFLAIDKIKSGYTYDIILMDHMMPRMDGIETVKILREEEGYTGTIVALTANALVGHAEMFLDNGFDGYISKPIDSRELNQILNEFVRNKQTPDVINAARREHAMTSGIIGSKPPAAEKPSIDKGQEPLLPVDPLDFELKELVVMDIEQTIETLEKLGFDASHFSDGEFDSYEIAVHGIKSALYNVGEIELSDFAKKLEYAAKEMNFELIESDTPVLLSNLKELLKKYK